MDAAVGGAGADREHGPGFRRQAVDPFARRHRLAGEGGLAVLAGAVAEAAPIAFAFDRLVGDRALDDQDERVDLAGVGLPPPIDEGVANIRVDQRPVERDLGQPGQGTESDLLDARLRRRGQGHGVAIAAQPGIDPEDVDDGLVLRRC